MTLQHIRGQALDCLRGGAALVAMWQISVGGALMAPDEAPNPATASPIKHVIITVGENRTFDHLFATYQPVPGQFVDNLRSKGIVNPDGTPGPNYSIEQQYSADVTSNSVYQPSPANKMPYAILPARLAGGPTNVCSDNGICTLADAETSEADLPLEYDPFMLSGGTGLTYATPDSRITGVSQVPPYTTLPPGPFQLTNTYSTDDFPYDSYATSPVHRFYQMWQQMDCSASHVTSVNLSGCLVDLFTWTEVTVGSNNNGKAQPANFSTEYGPGLTTTNEGATSMGFYNIMQGDAPYTKYLADHYAMSDNYHQPVMGGTGANSIMLGVADAIWFSDGNGNPATPPHDRMSGPEVRWTRSRIPTRSRARPVNPNCQPNHYYLLNNYNPGYFGDGTNAYTNTNSSKTPFTIPTKQRNIADLSGHHVSWAYYGDQWNSYLSDPYQLNYGTVGPQSDQYCNICNPFQYQTSVMTNPAMRANLKDTSDFYAAVANGTLLSVSYVKPSGWVAGHPASSKWNLFEGFVQKIVDAVQSNPTLWASTAIFITTDEGDGYYDSGYLQPVDFFGDGTRIPLLVVSPFTTPGRISHVYSDHASIIKFIERNWRLNPITGRGRDNLPNPTKGPSPYVPGNSPAIGDLFDLFTFSGQ